ncbi:MAG: streptomycin 6-kinase [Myxococcota bacterium]|jgi:streptomycin 6-kinase
MSAHRLTSTILKRLSAALLAVRTPLTTQAAVALSSQWHTYVDRPDRNGFETLLRAHPLLADNVQLTGTGVLLITQADRLIKVGMGQGAARALEREFANYQALQQSQLRPLVDYSHCRISRDDAELAIYRVQRLTLSPQPDVDAHSVLDTLAQYLSPEHQPLSRIMPDAMARGVQALTVICGRPPPAETLRRALSSHWRPAPMHGDLTRSNVMRAGARPVLIDLDRFTTRGVHEFDLVHLKIDTLVRARGTGWLAIVTQQRKALTQTVPRWTELRVPYFLHRVGAEFRPEVTMPPHWTQEVAAAWQRLIGEPDGALEAVA